jgi:hypothetical protein
MLAAILSREVEPQWDGESKVASRLLFCHGGRCRRGLPHDLDREMEDVRRKGEEVEEVSLGLDGDWFLRTNTRHGTFPPMSKPRTPINTINPWLKQGTTMLQHAKQTTGVRTWFQTSSSSCSSSNKPISVSRTMQSSSSLLCQTQLAMLRCCTKRTTRSPGAPGTMSHESSIWF